jgi:hypothetical protein
MDLNYLYHRHQISLFMAFNAACGKARSAHRGLAEGYAARIALDKASRRQAAA